MMSRYDTAQYVYNAVFLAVAVFCYGLEIWQRTPWTLVRQRLTLGTNKLFRGKTSQHSPNAAGINTALPLHSQHLHDPHSCDKAVGRRADIVSRTLRWLSQQRLHVKWILWLPGSLWLASIVLPLLQLYGSELHESASLLSHSTAKWNTTDLCDGVTPSWVLDALCADQTPIRVGADIGGAVSIPEQEPLKQYGSISAQDVAFSPTDSGWTAVIPTISTSLRSNGLRCWPLETRMLRSAKESSPISTTAH